MSASKLEQLTDYAFELITNALKDVQGASWKAAKEVVLDRFQRHGVPAALCNSVDWELEKRLIAVVG